MDRAEILDLLISLKQMKPLNCLWCSIYKARLAPNLFWVLSWIAGCWCFICWDIARSLFWQWRWHSLRCSPWLHRDSQGWESFYYFYWSYITPHWKKISAKGKRVFRAPLVQPSCLQRRKLRPGDRPTTLVNSNADPATSSPNLYAKQLLCVTAVK